MENLDSKRPAELSAPKSGFHDEVKSPHVTEGRNPIINRLKASEFGNSKSNSPAKGKKRKMNAHDLEVQNLLESNYETKEIDINSANKIRRASSKLMNLKGHFITDTISVVGCAVKEGQQLCGVELSPGLFRKCGLLTCLELLKWKVQDLGDIKLEDCQATIDKILAEDKKHKYDLGNIVTLGAMNQLLAEFCQKSSERGDFTLILGGDHGLATGSIGGMLRTHPNLKVVWIDAHSDCNTPETSPSQNYHGMPVAHLLGWIEEGEMKGFDWFKPCLKPENIVYIGLRDIDEGERINLKKHNIKCYSPFDIEMKGGIHTVMNEVEQYLDIGPNKQNPVHLSFDVDGCDPVFMPGTGTKARAGLTLRETHFILMRLFQTQNLVSMDCVEVNT